MKHYLLSTSLFILFFFALLAPVSSQKLSVGLMGGVSNHEIFFEWINPVNVKSLTTPKWETFHYGATARYSLYQGLGFRTDLYYMSSSTDFVAVYKVKDTEWTADASMKQNTVHFMLAPQINFGPRRIGYVYGGFMFEINSGTDFTKGQFTTVKDNGTTDSFAFLNDPVNNTTNPTAVVGIGINPRFGRFGFLLDARFTRSRAEAVHQLVPRIGRENVAFTTGFTYDIISE
jgi:Outer membrane protein beta-barrel domain